MEFARHDDIDLLQVLGHDNEPDGHFLRNLVRNALDLNVSSVQIESALNMAVMKNFVDSVRILLEAGVSPNTRWGGSEGNALSYCSTYKQRTDMVRVLLKHGANVNAEDSRKRTPLYMATSNQCVETMHELLMNGAKVDAVDPWGKTPFLRSLDFFPDVSVARVLLSAGAKVNLRDKYGMAPLHRAVEKRSPEAVRFLLQHKADANVRDKYGDTPLHRASFGTQQTAEIIKELLKGGARLNVLNRIGHSALYCALRNANEEASQEFLRGGASFDIIECLNALVESTVNRRPPYKVTTIACELIRCEIIKKPNSLESIRQQLAQREVVQILRHLSSHECNLESFKNACFSEVEAMSKGRCDCGKSSIWGSINDCDECSCDTQLAILKFLFSGRKTNFTDAFFQKLSEEYLLEVNLNLISYFEFKESKKCVMLNKDCVKEIQQYVSFEDVKSFLQSKQSEMNAIEFEKFLAFMKGESSVKASSKISSPGPKRLRVS